VKVVLGRVVGAHGVGGEVRVRVLGDGPENLLVARRVALADPRRGRDDPAAQIHEIEGGRTGRQGEVRLRLAGIADRDAAEALAGRLVVVEAAGLPALPPGEFYCYELIGCRVETTSGRALGRVVEVWDAGGRDLLVVEDEAGTRRLLPTARELMPEVDPGAGRIAVVDLPGLLEPAEAGPRTRGPGSEA